MKTQTRLALSSLAFVLVVLLSTRARELAGADWQVTALQLLPLLPAAVLGWLGFEHMRNQDEMHRRIQLEAAAFAFSITLAGAMAWLLVHAAFRLPSPTAATLVLVLGGSWFAGLLLAWRRYCGD